MSKQATLMAEVFKVSVADNWEEVKEEWELVRVYQSEPDQCLSAWRRLSLVMIEIG